MFIKFILSARFSNRLSGSDVLLFLELINLVLFFLYLYWIHFIVTYFFINFLIQRIDKKLNTKSICFFWLHSVNFQILYLLSLAQELLVIFGIMFLGGTIFYHFPCHVLNENIQLLKVWIPSPKDLIVSYGWKSYIYFFVLF